MGALDLDLLALPGWTGGGGGGPTYAKMTLLASDVNGGVAYVFTLNPKEMQRLRAEKAVGARRSLSSHVVWDWGIKGGAAGLAGLRRALYWPQLRIADWLMLRAFHESAQILTWDPKDKAHATGKTYTVAMLSLEAAHWPTLIDHMKDVKMVLQIKTVAN